MIAANDEATEFVKLTTEEFKLATVEETEYTAPDTVESVESVEDNEPESAVKLAGATGE